MAVTIRARPLITNTYWPASPPVRSFITVVNRPVCARQPATSAPAMLDTPAR
jgi:hypothetical protein